MPEGSVEELILGRILEQRAESHRHEPFLEFRDVTFTFGEVDTRTNRLAQGLAATGVGAGDHVAVMLPNCPEIVFAIFALAKLGAVAVPVNTAYRGDLLRHVLTSSECSSVIIDQPLASRLPTAPELLPDLRRVIVRTEPGAGPPDVRTFWDTTTLAGLMVHQDVRPDHAACFSDLLAIMYTSGSTGPSKGALVPHALALACAQDVTDFVNPDGEKIYCPLPLFHAAGLWDGMMSALLTGGTIAVVERFSASRFWDDVRHFDAKVAISVFSMLPILLNRPPTPRDREHPLKVFYTGKSALDAKFHERFGVRSVEAYTSTEAGVPIASPFGRWRTGSCGVVNSRRFEAAVVDDRDRPLPPGSAGELVLRPKQPYVLTGGYYGRFDATARAFRNMWFHTGDRVRQDDDGYFYFLDRMADAIRRRGENISAFDIESQVNSHPAVQECAVFGVPSDLGEDEVKIAVVPRQDSALTHEELLTYCREKLPGFMVPRYVEFVHALPRTATDKVAKHELRAAGDHGITPSTWDSRDLAHVPEPATEGVG